MRILFSLGLGGLFFLGVMLAGCGGDLTEGGENYGDILNTVAGLTLTEGEHPVGWGKSECTMCHNLENIHLVDRSGGVDIQAIHDRAIREGTAGCQACHGNNGVQ